eukprot:TRINITY_DN43608_c0_g1_i1.p1 TRINITY_DN43608_c0_g1~~TRINITY_DN43608_c0_g1_i1.p1  ORF type:complete len:255 (+),score=98.74 TRINITY_DN43608_c0_g1_i1:1-765(+)
MSMVLKPSLGDTVSTLAVPPQWVHSAVEVRTDPSSGRGLYLAGGDGVPPVSAGDVLLLDTPLVWRVGDPAADHQVIMTTDMLEKKLGDASLLRGETGLMYSRTHDRYTRRALAALHDGEDDRGCGKSALPVADLLNSAVSEANGYRPFLAFERDEGDQEPVSLSRLRKVLRLNAFGGGESLKRRTVGLYPAISMTNHSRGYNSVLCPLQFRDDPGRDAGVLLLATRDIAPGSEVTICYSDDPAVLKEKWDIEEG